VRRDDWRRYAAPAAFLLAVTLAVLLIRSGLESGTTTTQAGTTATTPRKQVTTATTTTTTTSAGTTATTATTASGKRYWTVRPGDTFGVISSQSGVSVAELARLNPKVSSTSLFIGQKIRIR
jgi:LysM repeat protein